MTSEGGTREKLRAALARVQEIEHLIREVLDGDADSTTASRSDAVMESASPVEASADERIVRALEARERQFRFVALTYFRDRVLPEVMPGSTSEQRHGALNRALHEGWILVERVDNPAHPSRPTASLRLNRKHPIVARALDRPVRFVPVRLPGEPLSRTVLEGRR